jgi:hypothetical protein
MTTAIVCALFAALLYGTGAAIEQHQAATAPDSAAGRLSLLGLLVRQPLWLYGLAVQIGGFVMHAAALRSGSLAVVQMIVAAELVVSVALVRVRSGRPVPAKVWVAGAAVLAGIVGFLSLTSFGLADVPRQSAVAARAAESTGLMSGTALGAVVSGAAAVVIAAIGLAVAGRRRVLLLAVAAGLADTGMAVVTTALAHETGHGAAAIIGSWPVYALVAGGICSLLLTQTAYQSGRPMVTLPVIAAVTPMASVAVGVTFLGDAARLGVVRTIAAGAVALATSAAIAVLARSGSAVRPVQARTAGTSQHESCRQHEGRQHGGECQQAGPRRTSAVGFLQPAEVVGRVPGLREPAQIGVGQAEQRVVAVPAGVGAAGPLPAGQQAGPD